MIEKLLSALDAQVEPFAICDVRRGWRMSLERQETATVHYALSGEGTIRIGEEGPFSFGPDTMIIVPRGVAQRIDSPGAQRSCAGDERHCVPLAEGLSWLQAGSGAPAIVMACGRMRTSYGAGQGLFDLLREPIIEGFTGTNPVHHAFRALLTELSNPRFGSKALAETLMKQCLIAVLRRLFERRDRRLPWMAAAEDPRLAAAVEAVLDHPERVGGVEGLAELAGMSRSAFSAHFSGTFGRTPHEFLTESRLRRAARFLETTALPVKTIASRIGYRSRSNFTRAFKAMYGVNPNAYRQGAAVNGGAPGTDAA
jgi:AraC-like DNA-binding protein